MEAPRNMTSPDTTRNLLDVLPGLPVPVEDVPKMLAHMWDSDPGTPAERKIQSFRASQMNLVLHLGLKTTAKEVNELFDTAILFAQRYPCRLIVLCPHTRKRGDDEVLEGKVFSQCYVGKNLRDMCCCEALALGYNTEDARFLEDQLSLWLETDLPVYHWFHRVPAKRIADCYTSIAMRATRSIFDSDIDPELGENPSLPDGVRPRDLAHARTLPMRQHIGQFLSVYPPRLIREDLERAELLSGGDIRGEGTSLLRWMRGAIERCVPAGDQVETTFAHRKAKNRPQCLEVEWAYRTKKKSFSWRYDFRSQSGRVKARFGGPPVDHPLHIEPLSRAASLAEALFF